MTIQKIAPKTMILLAVLALTALPTAAVAQRKNKNDGPKVGILATTVISSLSTSHKAEIRFNGGTLTVVVSPNAKYFVGHTESTIENFYAHASGQNVYVNINDLKPDVTIDRIWDGTSFAAYKKDSLSTSGTIAQHARNVFRVGDMVYIMTDQTKYYYNDAPSTKATLDVGMWAAVSGNSGSVYPEARIVKLWKNKPKSLGDKIHDDDKAVNENAKDKLKGGVGTVDAPKVKKPKGGIVKRGSSKSGKPGSNGKTKAGGNS